MHVEGPCRVCCLFARVLMCVMLMPSLWCRCSVIAAYLWPVGVCTVCVHDFACRPYCSGHKSWSVVRIAARSGKAATVPFRLCGLTPEIRLQLHCACRVLSFFCKPPCGHVACCEPFPANLFLVCVDVMSAPDSLKIRDPNRMRMLDWPARWP